MDTISQPPPSVPPEDFFMAQAASNVISMYKANEFEKVSALKYFGAIVTAIISITLAISRFGSDTHIERFFVACLLLLLYCVGVVILRKLFAVRRSTVVLSGELWFIYKYFIDNYKIVSEYIGKSFDLWSHETEILNKSGSDYFNFVMIAGVNTCVLLGSFFYLISGIETYLHLIKKDPTNLNWLIYIFEPIFVLLNVIMFFWFVKLTNRNTKG